MGRSGLAACSRGRDRPVCLGSRASAAIDRRGGLARISDHRGCAEPGSPPPTWPVRGWSLDPRGVLVGPPWERFDGQIDSLAASAAALERNDLPACGAFDRAGPVIARVRLCCARPLGASGSGLGREGIGLAADPHDWDRSHAAGSEPGNRASAPVQGQPHALAPGGLLDLHRRCGPRAPAGVTAQASHPQGVCRPIPGAALGRQARSRSGARAV